MVCVCVVVGGGGGGGGQNVRTIQTSTMTPLYRLQYHVCRPVLAGSGSGYKCISLSQRVRKITMEVSTDVK